MFNNKKLKIDFNSCNIANKESLQKGNLSSRTVPMDGFPFVSGSVITRSVLAKTSNGAIVLVYIAYDGETEDYKSMAIFYDGAFQRNCPKFYFDYGLNSSDYKVTHICKELNSGSTQFVAKLNIETTFPTNDDKISSEELVDKIRGIADLKYSYEVYYSPDQTEYHKVISTHNAIACRDDSGYIMPCTVEFKNNVKTICYCYVLLDFGVAVTTFFLEDNLKMDDKKLFKRIINIRPLIVSPVGSDGVVVSEGLKLRFVSRQEYERIIRSAE